jgi:hypothetical protein
MPRGPRGEKRPADVIGAAVMVGRIATGEIVDTRRNAATEANRKGGLKGGKARAKKLTPKQRAEIAHTAAEARRDGHGGRCEIDRRIRREPKDESCLNLGNLRFLARFRRCVG